METEAAAGIWHHAERLAGLISTLRSCLYKCGALTLAGSVPVTAAGYGPVGTCSSFWNSPASVSGWGSSSGDAPGMICQMTGP